jgi:hypothetical protein
MIGYVANPISCEAIKEFRDELADFQIDEVLLTTVFHCWKSRKFSPEVKICVLELFSERLEKDIEILNTQIQSYNFQNPK